MRELNKKQKRILEEWFEKHKDEVGISFKAEDLDDDVYDKLIDINEFETINSEIENYVDELLSRDVEKEEKRLNYGG